MRGACVVRAVARVASRARCSPTHSACQPHPRWWCPMSEASVGAGGGGAHPVWWLIAQAPRVLLPTPPYPYPLPLTQGAR